MNPQNAIIKDAGIRVSERYSESLDIWMELKLQNGGGCVFTVSSVFAKEWSKNQMGYALKRILDIVGVDSFEDIKGKPIRAKFNSDGCLGDLIIGIGNFLSDDWFVPREEELWRH